MLPTSSSVIRLSTTAWAIQIWTFQEADPVYPISLFSKQSLNLFYPSYSSQCKIIPCSSKQEFLKVKKTDVQNIAHLLSKSMGFILHRTLTGDSKETLKFRWPRTD